MNVWLDVIRVYYYTSPVYTPLPGTVFHRTEYYIQILITTHS